MRKSIYNLDSCRGVGWKKRSKKALRKCFFMRQKGASERERERGASAKFTRHENERKNKKRQKWLPLVVCSCVGSETLISKIPVWQFENMLIRMWNNFHDMLSDFMLLVYTEKFVKGHLSVSAVELVKAKLHSEQLPQNRMQATKKFSLRLLHH